MKHEVQLRTSKGSRRFVIDEAFVSALPPVEQDNEEVITLFVASWLALLSDSPLTTGLRPPRVFAQFLRRLKTDGVKATIISFSNLAHEFVACHHIMGTDSLIGPWNEAFECTPIIKEYIEYFQTGDPELARYIYTFLNFGKKLEIVDPEFNATAFRSWLGVEKRLNDLTLAEDDTSVLKQVLKAVLPVFEVADFRPKFGPGAVAERRVRGRNAKIKTLAYDRLIDRFLFHGHVGNYGCGGEAGLSPKQVLPDPAAWTPDRGISSRISKLMFVPKNVKTARSICMEPNTLMYFQQGVMAEMTRLIRSSVLGSSIRLKDQSWNRGLALLGSYTSEVDTLDLSSASDSVSWELVKKVFPSSWVIPMYATRSSCVELPGDRGGLQNPFQVKKFAPMGSAVCFPTQCIIFAGVCIMAACLYTYANQPEPKVPFSVWLTESEVRSVYRLFWRKQELAPQGYFQPLGIYGDDICVDRRLSDIVKAILDRLGFVVNTEKSFCGSQAFRESCGGYYLDGHDITPVYFRVTDVRWGKLSPTHVASHVHLCNEAWNKSYRNLYRFLRFTILGWGVDSRRRNRHSDKNPIPFVTNSEEWGIMCLSANNQHLESREQACPLDPKMPWYQRREVRAWTITYEERIPPGDLLGAVESYLHMRWWPAHQGESSDDFETSAPRWQTGKPGLRWRWIPSE